MSELHDNTTVVPTALLLVALVLLSILVFVWREELSKLAVIGYPTVFMACFLLNSGVFGLSPSGAVAVEASFLFDPFITAIVAGLGAGAGEITSFVAGITTDELFVDERLDVIRNWRPIYIALAALVASLISGNLSDAFGIAAGRAGGSPLPFMVGATLAKVIKMLALVLLAHGGLGFLQEMEVFHA